jgi:hypothetical protein
MKRDAEKMQALQQGILQAVLHACERPCLLDGLAGRRPRAWELRYAVMAAVQGAVKPLSS